MSENKDDTPRAGMLRSDLLRLLVYRMQPVDASLRQAIHQCWALLPEDQRTHERLSQVMEALMQKALIDFAERPTPPLR